MKKTSRVVLTLALAAFASVPWLLPADAQPTGATPAATAPASPGVLPSIPTIQAPTGDSIRAREYWLTSYGFEDAWKQATGKGVTVAVIDTGVDGTHQDLTGNVEKGYDASEAGSKNGWKGLGIEPEHGTLVEIGRAHV